MFSLSTEQGLLKTARRRLWCERCISISSPESSRSRHSMCFFFYGCQQIEMMHSKDSTGAGILNFVLSASMDTRTVLPAPSNGLQCPRRKHHVCMLECAHIVRELQMQARDDGTNLSQAIDGAFCLSREAQASFIHGLSLDHNVLYRQSCPLKWIAQLSYAHSSLLTKYAGCLECTIQQPERSELRYRV